MKKNFSYIIPLSVTAVMVLFLFFALKPTAINRENSIEFTATVSKVKNGGLNNIALSFEGMRGVYSISQTGGAGFNADSLHKQLVNKSVSAAYLKPGFFSRFHPMADVKHITEIKLGGRVIYSELED